MKSNTKVDRDEKWFAFTGGVASRLRNDHGLRGWLLDFCTVNGNAYCRVAIGRRVMHVRAHALIRAVNANEGPGTRCVVVCTDRRSAFRRFIDTLRRRDPIVLLRVFTEGALVEHTHRWARESLTKVPKRHMREARILNPGADDEIPKPYRNHMGRLLEREQSNGMRCYRIAVGEEVIRVVDHAVRCFATEPRGTPCKVLRLRQTDKLKFWTQAAFDAARHLERDIGVLRAPRAMAPSRFLQEPLGTQATLRPFCRLEL